MRKGAHQEEPVAIPAKYIRESYGKRVHEALMELAEHTNPQLVKRKPFAAPTEGSLKWNVKNGHISMKEARRIDDTGRGKCFKYRFSEDALNRSKWVVHTVKKEDHHHHTWNAIFPDQRNEWEKSHHIQATSGLIDELEGSDRPWIKPLALSNRRLTFSKKGDALGRRYTTFGSMRSDLRKYFRINGDRLVELDITNSIFFHFFGRLNSFRDALTNEHGNWCPDRTEHMAEKITATDEWFSNWKPFNKSKMRAIRKKKQNIRGHWAQEEYVREKTKHLTPQQLCSFYYNGTKLTIDYRYKGYIDLDPIIKAASDEGEQDFYQYLQGYMEDQYQNPSRNFAKIQANTWANSQNYFFYEDENGKRTKNEKRWDFAGQIKRNMELGWWRKRYPIGLDKLFGANGDRTGCGMMREEARMMLGSIQPAVEDSIESETLAVHDALYVPESKAEKAKEEMKATYRKEYGVAPQITLE